MKRHAGVEELMEALKVSVRAISGAYPHKLQKS